MSVHVNPERLRYELAIRGMAAIDLAKKARLSPATISAVFADKPISETSLRLVARALDETPTIEIIGRLVAPALRLQDAPTVSGGEDR